MDSESVLETGTAIAPIGGISDRLTLVCGLPSAMTYFIADLVRDMLARSHGKCSVVNLNDLSEDTCEHLLSLDGKLLGLAEVPNADVAHFALAANFPIILIDQNFSDACQNFMAARDANLLDTVRTMARSQIGLDQLASVPRSVSVNARKGESTEIIVEQIATTLKAPKDVWRSMVNDRSLSQPLNKLLESTFEYGDRPLISNEGVIIEEVSKFYCLPLEQSLSWNVPLEILLEAKPPHLPATNTIDLLGPARGLTCGPYLYLPQGKWAIEFVFTTSENESTNIVGFDVAADDEVKIAEDFEILNSGKFEFRCNFEIRDPFHPFEFRCILRRGSIGGNFLPVSLFLMRI